MVDLYKLLAKKAAENAANKKNQSGVKNLLRWTPIIGPAVRAVDTTKSIVEGITEGLESSDSQKNKKTK